MEIGLILFASSFLLHAFLPLRDDHEVDTKLALKQKRTGDGVTSTSLAAAGGGLNWSMQNKKCVVTGGTRGIGRAIVNELLVLGASVVTCSRNKVELEELGNELIKFRDQLHLVEADMSSKIGRDKLLSVCDEVYGGSLNCLINNVGCNVRKKTIDYSEDEYIKIMSTNLDSAFFLTKAAHQMLKSSGNYYLYLLRLYRLLFILPSLFSIRQRVSC